MARTLDCSGLPCPQPVLRCRDLIAKETPQAFDVVVDNAPAVENVTRFLGKSGYAVTCEQKGDKWELHAQRTADAPVSQEVPPCLVPENSRVGKTVLLLATDCVGRGDEELGRTIMGNFITTFHETSDRLWAVILMNYGVRLSTGEGKALEGLKQLEADGVKICSCGTCLVHFGLTDQLKVGEVSNMLDIVTMLSECDKVINV